MWPSSGDMMPSHDYQMGTWDSSRGPEVQGSVKPLGFLLSLLDTPVLSLMMMVRTTKSTSGQGML